MIIYNNFNLLKVGGYLFVDDISHLPYLNDKKSSFYCEINNKETFEMLLSVYFYNQNCLNINFSFKSSGLAIIKKISDDNLNYSKKIPSREKSIKNLIRIIWKNLKRD